MFSSNKPNYTKLRTNLRLCINRLKLLEKKKTELALKARREIADFIASGKEDRARIRVEHIVREDYLVEAMEIVEMLCDLLLARFGLIDRMAELDPGIEEAVATLIWVTPRLSADIQELQEVSHQLALKYSKEFAEMCRRNEFQKVNEKVIHKMSTAVPPKILIENYMIEIARSYKVPFEPDPIVMMGEPPAVSNLIDLGAGTSSVLANGSAAAAAESFLPSAATGPAMINSAPSDARYPLYDNNADQKKFEASGGGPGVNGKRPPSPPGGGGGMGCKTPFSYEAMGGPQPTIGVSGAAHMNQYSPPHSRLDLPPATGGYTPVGPPALPTRPPNSNQGQGSPENLNQAHQQDGASGGKQPYNPAMSWPDEQLPSLPAYDSVVNSPMQYPSPHSSTTHTTAQQPQQPVPQPRLSPVPAPRGGVSGGLLPSPPGSGELPGLPSVPVNSVGVNSVGGDDVNFDDLTRRFEELKRKNN